MKSSKNALPTFSFDLKHADGILRAEGAELAGGQRVAAAAARHRGAHVKGLDERQCTHHRHVFCFLKSFFFKQKKGFKEESRAASLATSPSTQGFLRLESRSVSRRA